MSPNIKVKIFPTLLQFTNNFLNTIECRKIIKSISKNKLSEHLCLNGNAKSTHAINSNILTKPIKEKLQIKIKQKLDLQSVEKVNFNQSY